MVTKRIPLDMLFADRKWISFRDVPDHTSYRRFSELRNVYRTRVPEEPIQVTTQGPYYVIRYGYRRALAALETGRLDIDAHIERDNEPICQLVELKNLKYSGRK